jgi:hypothetical protein
MFEKLFVKTSDLVFHKITPYAVERESFPAHHVKRAHTPQILDLIFEDNRLNVYAGEVEVRPPGAPTTRASAMGRERGALEPDGRYMCVGGLARRVSGSQCGRKRLQRSRLKPVVRQCGRFMQPSGLYTP